MKKLLTLILAAMLVGCGSTKPTGDTVMIEKKSEKEEVVQEEKVPNQDYIDMVKCMGYDDIYFKYPGLECTMLGHMIDEISLEILSFGSKNDVVSMMTNAIYYNISDFDEEQRAMVEDYIKEVSAPFEELDFCKVTYGIQDDNTYVLKLEYSEMDNSKHIKAAVDAGGLQLTEDSAKTVTYLSLKDTVKALTDGGWTLR